MYFTRTQPRRVAVRLRDPRDRRASRRDAGDGSDGVLALPHVHRRAGAADDVPGHLQAARRPRAHASTTAARRRRGSTGTARPTGTPRSTERDISEPEAVAELTRLLQAVDRAPDGVGRAVRRAAVGRRRLVDERRADERAHGAARSRRSRSATRGRKTTTSSSSRAASASATRPIITRR